MIISNSKKYIFVHLTKCGGTSVTHALEEKIIWNDIICGRTNFGRSMKAAWGERWGIGTHASAQEIANLVGEEVWSEYFIFSFVRHPFKRVLSRYSWTEEQVQKLGWRRYARHVHSQWDYGIWEWNTVQAYLDTSSFSEYLRHPAMDEVFSNRTQAQSLSDNQGALMVDYVGKVEHMSSDFAEVCRRIGISADLPKRNKTNSRNINFCQDDKIYVFEKCSIDYKLFSYEA